MDVVEPSEIIIGRANPFEQDAAKINPWVRFLARFTDYALFSLILTLIGHFLFPQLNWKRLEFFIPLEFLFWVLIEALLISRWQTTPGKWLLKTKVKSVNGTKPTYEKAIHRAFSVWFRGIGMGIPIINLITMLVAYSRLKTQGKTSWDREEKTKVIHAPIARFRLGIAIGIILISLIVNGYQKRHADPEKKKSKG